MNDELDAYESFDAHVRKLQVCDVRRSISSTPYLNPRGQYIPAIFPSYILI
jgi:hypothetical protein